jgi:hypothetical protein
MLFASGSFGEGVIGVFFLLSIGVWAAGRLSRKHDPEGRIKEAAKGGIIRMIGRWMR